MKILAHRGWWETKDQRNTEAAFVRAFENGFGVETDVRDQNGVLKIAHDMPMGDGLMDFETFLALHKSHERAGEIALNIKADGLQSEVKRLTEAQGVDQLFCFDMAVPDSLGYLRQGFVTYTRHSEYEPTPPFYAEAHGVWIDCFLGDWITPEVIQAHLEAGKKVALVSPELHGRDKTPAWDMWAGIKSDDVAICTDLPHLAAEKWS
jgi:glycerophosphoryl diester phosphodiesterase